VIYLFLKTCLAHSFLIAGIVKLTTDHRKSHLRVVFSVSVSVSVVVVVTAALHFDLGCATKNLYI